MSRSKRDQRGKRINKEIGLTVAVRDDGKVLTDLDWLPKGSPSGKQTAKREARRARRRVTRNIINQEKENVDDSI